MCHTVEYRLYLHTCPRPVLVYRTITTLTTLQRSRYRSCQSHCTLRGSWSRLRRRIFNVKKTQVSFSRPSTFDTMLSYVLLCSPNDDDDVVARFHPEGAYRSERSDSQGVRFVQKKNQVGKKSGGTNVTRQSGIRSLFHKLDKSMCFFFSLFFCLFPQRGPTSFVRAAASTCVSLTWRSANCIVCCTADVNTQYHYRVWSTVTDALWDR